MAKGRGGRILAAVAMIAATGLVGADGATAVTGTPTFVIATPTVARGASTTFTSTFTMDEGMAQATLTRAGGVALPAGVTATFTGCPAAAGRSCSIDPGGAVTVVNGGPAGIDNVEVTITGAINASAAIALGSTEGTGPGTLTLPDLTLNLNQDATPRPSAVGALTVVANPATDAEIQIMTAAPLPTDGGRGASTDVRATLRRVGFLTQATSATATLVADVAAGTTITAPACGLATAPPCSSKLVDWASGEVDKPVSLSFFVPSAIALGGPQPRYHIVVAYDANALAPAVLDTEVGDAKDFTIVPGPADAVITIETTAPAVVPPDIARGVGVNVTYTATLTRSGNTAQVTSVSLSLMPGPQSGTTPGPPVPVLFADGVMTATASITVDVPPTATIGTVAYSFQGIYRPIVSMPAGALDRVTDTARSFNVVAATPSFTLSPGDRSVTRGAAPFNLLATLNNPAGAVALTGGVITVTVPVGMSAGSPTATPGYNPLLPPVAVPSGPGAVPQVVIVTYPTIAAGVAKTLTIPVSVLGSATKKAGADLTVDASFVSVLPVFTPIAKNDFEITPDADVKIVVTAPATEQLDPTSISIPVTYQVTNAGPDPADTVKFVATAPAGFVGASPDAGGDANGDGIPDWSCNSIPVGSPSTTCTYQGGAPLVPPTPTTPAPPPSPVVITWTFNAIGTKTFAATVTTTTNDTVPGNNVANNGTAPTTVISNPTSGVTIAASASPDPAVVAVDSAADVTVAYVVKNTGPKNIKAKITVVAPAGAVLQSLSIQPPSAGASCTVATASCDLGTLAKPAPPSGPSGVTVLARYLVAQSAFVANRVTFSADLASLNGGTFAAGSTTTASASVAGTPPTIDIGLATVTDNPVVNRPAGTVATPASPVVEPRTFTYQNFSTQFTVRAGTAFIELTAAPATGIGLPVGCVVTTAPTVRCAIAAVVPVASGTTPATVTLTVGIPLLTADLVTISARAIVVDGVNRNVAANPATPDTRDFTLDLNRLPTATSDAGPGIPAGGTLGFLPVPLHADDDGDVLHAVDAATNLCAPPAAATSCTLTGGTATGLSVLVSGDRLSVTFTDVAPTGSAPVTVLITYSVTDGKSSTPSRLKVKLLPQIILDQPSGPRASIEGSFGKTPSPAPKSFGTQIGADRVGDTASTIKVLDGELGTDANGAAFPGFTSYDLTSVSKDSLNVQGASSLDKQPDGPKMAVRYVPVRGYTSDAPAAPNPNLIPKAPPDGFTYTTTGSKGTAASPIVIFTVDAAVTMEIKNQSPIGVDDTFDLSNGNTSIFRPAVNDLDGNFVDAPIKVARPATPPSFIFDDEGKNNEALGLRVLCIGPVEVDPTTKVGVIPSVAPDVLCPSSGPATGGFKKADDALVLGSKTGDSKGEVTVKLAGSAASPAKDAFRAVTVTADATVVGKLQFAYIDVDNYGGTGFGLATVSVPNTPPVVIPEKQTVIKNTPKVVVDTRLAAATDANNDTIVVSGAPARADHGTVSIGDNNRTITYSPDKDFIGEDKFTYSVSDGRADGSASATLQLNVVAPEGVLAATNTSSGGAAGQGGGGTGKAPAGGLAKTGGDPLPLTAAAGGSLVLGLALLQAGRRRQSRPLLDQASHLRT